MNQTKKGYENLGPNIRALRKNFGESLLDLAMELGVGVTAVSQYENGKRIPKEEILFKIAKHFRITETQLLRDVFEESDFLEKIPVNDAQFTKEMIKTIYPRFSNEEALQNPNFKAALRIQRRVYDAIFSATEVDEKDTEQFIELYRKALEEGILLGAANLLSFFMLVGANLTYLNPGSMEKLLSVRGKVTAFKEIATMFLYSAEDEECEEAAEFKQEKADFLEEYTPLIQKCIAKLKRSQKYASLGDYYLALRFINGMAYGGKEEERYSEVGREMMRAFKNLGNPYAKRYVSFLE